MYGNLLNYATLFFLKYNLFLVLVGLAEVWGGSEQGWVCSRRELIYVFSIFMNLFHIATFFLASYSHFSLDCVQKAR